MITTTLRRARAPAGPLRWVSSAVTAAGERAVAPVDFAVASKVQGNESQVVSVTLAPKQRVRGEPGSLIYYTAGVTMDTSTGGGILEGLRRLATSSSLMVTDFVNEGAEDATVVLGSEFPSKIVQCDLSDFHDSSLICQKSAFLAGSHTLTFDVEFTRTFAAGFFGGEGFMLQRIGGEGTAFLRAGGSLMRRELAPGEVLSVTSGAIVAFEPSVEYDVTMLQGFKNVVFGGEGLFVTTLRGPGTVFLQSMPFDRLVDAVARRVPRGGGLALGVPVGGGGGGDGGDGGDGGGFALALRPRSAVVFSEEAYSEWLHGIEASDEVELGGQGAAVPCANLNAAGFGDAGGVLRREGKRVSLTIRHALFGEGGEEPEEDDEGGPDAP